MCQKKCDCLRVLMIGNSFSLSVGEHFPQIVRSVPGVHLALTSLYIGGCSLQTHWENILQAKQEPSFKPYRVSHWDSELDGCIEEYGNIQEQLAYEWDIITVQQASSYSWRKDSYQPYFDNLIAFVKQMAPQAEIVIQQTWAYRNSDERMPEWGINQTEMYEKLTENYFELAKKYQFRVIPTGLAVQLTRKGISTIFPRPSTIQPESYAWPDLPSQAHEVVGAYRWSKTEEGKLVITQDSIHLNPRGEYLQGCVWFARLFGRPASQITYVPQFMDNGDADFLKQKAQEAVDSVKKLQE